jgi:hypothetical protein
MSRPTRTGACSMTARSAWLRCNTNHRIAVHAALPSAIFHTDIAPRTGRPVRTHRYVMSAYENIF